MFIFIVVLIVCVLIALVVLATRKNQTSSDTSSYLQKKIHNSFESAVKTALKNKTGISMVDGTMVYYTIANCYDTLKKDNGLNELCNTQNIDYSKILEEELWRTMHKYINKKDGPNAIPFLK